MQNSSMCKHVEFMFIVVVWVVPRSYLHIESILLYNKWKKFDDDDDDDTFRLLVPWKQFYRSINLFPFFSCSLLATYTLLHSMSIFFFICTVRAVTLGCCYFFTVFIANFFPFLDALYGVYISIKNKERKKYTPQSKSWTLMNESM